jgi:hypothetical protein
VGTIPGGARLTAPPPERRQPVHAYGYYNNYYNGGCYYDTYGNRICPQQQYPYPY